MSFREKNISSKHFVYKFTKCVKFVKNFNYLCKKNVLLGPYLQQFKTFTSFAKKTYYPFEIINQSVLVSLSCRNSS